MSIINYYYCISSKYEFFSNSGILLHSDTPEVYNRFKIDCLRFHMSVGKCWHHFKLQQRTTLDYLNIFTNVTMKLTRHQLCLLNWQKLHYFYWNSALSLGILLRRSLFGFFLGAAASSTAGTFGHFRGHVTLIASVAIDSGLSDVL